MRPQPDQERPRRPGPRPAVRPDQENRGPATDPAGSPEGHAPCCRPGWAAKVLHCYLGRTIMERIGIEPGEIEGLKHCSAPDHRRSPSNQSQSRCSTQRWASWICGVRSAGTFRTNRQPSAMAASLPAIAAGQRRGASCPSRWRRSMALTTLGELPLVEIPRARSPVFPGPGSA